MSVPVRNEAGGGPHSRLMSRIGANAYAARTRPTASKTSDRTHRFCNQPRFLLDAGHRARRKARRRLVSRDVDVEVSSRQTGNVLCAAGRVGTYKCWMQQVAPNRIGRPAWPGRRSRGAGLSSSFPLVSSRLVSGRTILRVASPAAHGDGVMSPSTCASGTSHSHAGCCHGVPSSTGTI